MIILSFPILVFVRQDFTVALADLELTVDKAGLGLRANLPLHPSARINGMHHYRPARISFLKAVLDGNVWMLGDF